MVALARLRSGLRPRPRRRAYDDSPGGRPRANTRACAETREPVRSEEKGCDRNHRRGECGSYEMAKVRERSGVHEEDDSQNWRKSSAGLTRISPGEKLTADERR